MTTDADYSPLQLPLSFRTELTCSVCEALALIDSAPPAVDPALPAVDPALPAVDPAAVLPVDPALLE